MTNESSNDSRHGEPALSPRRAARAAREQAELQQLAQQTAATPEPTPNQVDPGTSHSSETGNHGDPVQEPKAEKAGKPAGERSEALRAAHQARTQGALRARTEAIEAQRTASERIRQTLRANSATRRSSSPEVANSAVNSSTLVEERPEDVIKETSAEPANAPIAAHQGNPTATPSSMQRPASGDHAQPEASGNPPASSPADAATDAMPIVAASLLPGSGSQPMDPGSSSPQSGPAPGQTGPDEWFDGHEYTNHASAPGTDEAVAHGGGVPEDGYQDPHGYDRDGVEPDAYAEQAERENLFLATPTIDPEKRKARRRRRNWVLLVVLLGFSAVIFGVVLFLQGLLDRLSPQDFPAPGGETVSFEVESGWGPKQIGRELVNRDIVASDKLFLEAVQLVETENRVIHPGTYDLRMEMPALDAASILIGEEAAKVSYVAIKENTRMSKVLEQISESTGLPMKEIAALADDPAALGVTSKAPNLEGYLHPGEYRFPLDADAETVLRTMVDATTKTLNDAGIIDPVKQYHVLKVASILQAEARKDDYGTVAGALENRLHPDNKETSGLLQVDSAVIYGLDRYSLQFSAAEKKDPGNKYNTYVRKGLPPTPIGSPGNSAIKAAANPTPNDYYYWVTVNTNTGETKFAKSYSEHRVYQDEFRSWCAANTDVCK
ncbi:endolytic transglycosylase MltG [Paeniglutamicibacter antarcticus]|uniref:Endolytic murein transglycosylase n=1 Tax=Paeniglutamicibacter antarcticus TaxID=494023 RepID=A0ABP9TLV8_9MICC